MTDASTSPGRRFVDEFSAWLNPRNPADPDNGVFFETAMIVVDTNVLLDLYRVSSATRAEILTVLSRTSDRLWIPHQVALEYSRNRRKVVIDRNIEFSDIKAALRKSEKDAIDGLDAALRKFIKFRDKNRSNRDWDPAEFGLDQEGIKGRIKGIWDQVLQELDNLEREIDLSEKDLAADPILVELNDLLTGRVGPAPSTTDLQRHVERFVHFRFPSKLPPGYEDVAKKEEPVRQAGDYLLWKQLIDHLCSQASRIEPRRVMLVTGDSKPDWWELDRAGNPIRARPELVHELRREANAELLLLSLTQLLQGAKDYLNYDVSDAAISEVQEREEEDQLADLLPEFVRQGRSFNVSEISYSGLESVVLYLLLKMEFKVTRYAIRRGADFVATDSEGQHFAVDVYLRRGTVGIGQLMNDAQHVLESMDAMITREVNVDRGMLITTAMISRAARSRIREELGNLVLIGREELRELLELHAGIRMYSSDGW
ncbi:DUF4935 domain-containing protein [Nocardia sp. BSTN01]|uniref:PIN-like domain-containing protein n=1 Tax=Nocardia sp. BSTN01 TaxID=2783665 RepID=UPI0018905EF4|nr:PIN-like domain-containing protein [Nocardia sp. BSTN01]MBF5000343.1 DUF4935 domain-containing protein [Nocardia sp. BSTN01]